MIHHYALTVGATGEFNRWMRRKGVSRSTAAQDPLSPSSAVAAYDRKAEEYDWRGPEVGFGLSYSFVNSGESVLDIGVGTGLGSILFHKAGLHVYGMIFRPRCSKLAGQRVSRRTSRNTTLHYSPTLTIQASLDHAVCLGVLNFFRNLQPVFGEVARIVRDDGVFVFAVGDRAPREEAEFVVGPEHTQSDSIVTMYRHGTDVINRLLEDNDFELLRHLEFPVPMDRERSKVLHAKAYVARRKGRKR